MNRRLLVLIPIVIAVLIVLFVYPVGVRESEDRPMKSEQLVGQSWVLDSLVNDGQRVLLSDDIRITIQFDEEGMVRGSGGCNTFFGEYLISVEYQISGKSGQGIEEQIGVGGMMSLESIFHTERACIEAGRMEQEGQFFAALGPVTKFQVTSESLKLFTGEEPSDVLIIFGILE